MPETKVPQRYLYVDALRALAALGVVVFHTISPTYTPHLVAQYPAALWLASWAGFGVAVFFALSGFVIAHSLYGRRISPKVFGLFLIRRSVRLDPPYWVAIALVVAAAYLSTRYFNKPETTFTPAQIVAHMFYLQDLLGYVPLNAVFWTLCLEVQFYAVFAGLLMLRKRIYIWVIAFVIAALFPLQILPSDGFLRATFLPWWHTFLLGVGAYWATRDRSLAPYIVGYALILIAAAIYYDNRFSLVSDLTAMSLLVAARMNKMETWLSWRPLLFLGGASYSLYITHSISIGLAYRLVGGAMYPSLSSDIVGAALAIGVSLAAAVVFWWCLELPSLNASKLVKMGDRGTATMPAPASGFAHSSRSNL